MRISNGWPLIKKLEVPQKKILWSLVGITICLLIYLFGILPLVDAKRKTEDEIFLKKRTLVKYEQFLRNRKAMEEELNRMIKQYEGVQQQLLSGETPQLGAANLQEIVKRLAEKNSIGIRSFRILEAKEINGFRKISVHIEFNPINNVLSLGQFIQDIEHQEKESMISEMDLLITNPRMPNSVQGSFIISGLMKGGQTKEKRREG